MTKIKIYQLDKNNEETKGIISFPYEWVGGNVKEGNYNLVYELDVSGVIDNKNEVEDLLANLCIKFNMNKPSDFEGRKLGMSDVIGINSRFFYIDNRGFIDITKEWKISIFEEFDDIIKIKYFLDRDVLAEIKYEAYNIYIENKDMTKEKAINIAYNKISEKFKKYFLRKI